MPNIGNYLNASAIEEADRAETAWARIQDKPTSIVINRKGGNLAAQTVRVEFSTTVREIKGESGTSSARDVIVFGIREHPTLTDTDLRRGDKFAFDDVQYRIIDIVTTLGSVQARCQAMS